MAKRKKRFNRKEVRELVLYFSTAIVLEMQYSDEARDVLLNRPERPYSETQSSLQQFFTEIDNDNTVFGPRLH